MSITDELMEWTRNHTVDCSDNRIALVTIAKRIDAEHEAKVSYWQGASYKDGYDEGFASADDWLEQHEDAMAEHGWVRLPLDADGEPIHIGDVMENTVCPSVHRETTGVGVECFYGWDEGNGRYSQFDADRYRHHHAPTVEDVLTEFGIDWEYESDCEDRAALLKEYAKRLTLAGDAE